MRLPRLCLPTVLYVSLPGDDDEGRLRCGGDMVVIERGRASSEPGDWLVTRRAGLAAACVQ